MKGQKIYNLATLINEKLYEYPSDLNHEEKLKLYYEYFSLIRRSSYLGFIEAQYDYAQQYENISFLGVNNPLYDPKKCIYWYSKACDRGHSEACNNLAHIYHLGDKCEKNLELALKLYRKSAELGSDNGKRNYKMMLHKLAKDKRSSCAL